MSPIKRESLCRNGRSCLYKSVQETQGNIIPLRSCYNNLWPRMGRDEHFTHFSCACRAFWHHGSSRIPQSLLDSGGITAKHWWRWDASMRWQILGRQVASIWCLTNYQRCLVGAKFCVCVCVRNALLGLPEAPKWAQREEDFARG